MTSKDPSKQKAFEDTISGIQKSFGKSSIMKLNENRALNVEGFHSGSLNLDIALGGKGIPRGRIIELFGAESSGKCLPGDTYLFTENGIETVFGVFARNGLVASNTTRSTPKQYGLMNRHGEIEETCEFTNNGRRAVLSITTHSGAEISSTLNHPHLVLNTRGNLVWKKTGDLQRGEYMVSRRDAHFGAGKIPIDTSYSIGAMVADGHFEEKRIQFTNDDPDVLSICVPEVTRMLSKEPVQYPNNEMGSVKSHWSNKSEVLKFYDDYKLCPGRAKDKHVPEGVLTGDHECVKAFLQGYFDCECHINTSRCSIDVVSASKRLLHEIKLMLLQFGIVSILREKKVAKYPDNDYWTLGFCGREALKYKEMIGSRSERRREALNSLTEGAGSTNFDSIPHMGGLLRDLYDSMETTRSTQDVFSDIMGDLPRARLTYERLSRILSLKGLPDNHIVQHLAMLNREKFLFDEIVDIKDGGSVPTFDFEMPNTHSFIANGLITHNSTLCLHMIAAVQQLGGNVAFIDAEHALDPEWALKLGVDLDAMAFSQPTTGEEALKIVDYIVASAAFDLIVVDSVAALVPKQELEGEMGDSHVGLQARMMGQAMRKLTHSVAASKTTVVFVNQIRCISQDELVIGPNGLTHAGDLAAGDSIVNGAGEWDEVSERVESMQASRTVTLSDGRTITCGITHPIMVMGQNGAIEWREAGSLSPGDYVGTPLKFLPEIEPAIVPTLEIHRNAIPCPMPSHCNNAICRFLGMWYSDGFMIEADKSVRFTENSSERMDALVSIANDLEWPFVINGPVIRFPSSVYHLLDVMGCSRGSANKLVPQCVSGAEQWKAFMKGFFDTHFTNSGAIRLNVSVQNSESRKKIQLALLGLGIHSSQYVRKDGHGVLGISGRDLDTYLDVIGFSEPSKAETARQVKGRHSDGARGKADVVPYPKEFILLARKSPNWKTLDARIRSRAASVLSQGLAMSRHDYCTIRDHCDVKGNADDARWFPVKTVCDGPEIPMVDFNVKSHHTFIAGGISTHNCNIGVLFGSNETTPGGRALKFYSSCRIKLNKIKTLKEGDEASGIRVRAQVVKNKIAPPFRKAEYDLIPDGGINPLLELIDLAVEKKVLKKSGGWYSFEGVNLANGKDNTRRMIEDDNDLRAEIAERTLKACNVSYAKADNEDLEGTDS